MSPESGESGLEELMRLSRQTRRQAQSMDAAEKQRQIQRETAMSIRKGLKEISISVAVRQLKQVAPKEVVEQVQGLANKPDIRDLRRMISDLLHRLERQTGNLSTASKDLDTIGSSVKTLAILCELYFALSD
jgi:predicted component of type VI protein secretion system